MSTEVDDQTEATPQPEKRTISSNGDLAAESGGDDRDHDRDQLVQMVMELRLQNEFLKSEFAGFRSSQPLEPAAEKDVVESEAAMEDVQRFKTGLVDGYDGEQEDEKDARHWGARSGGIDSH